MFPDADIGIYRSKLLAADAAMTPSHGGNRKDIQNKKGPRRRASGTT